MRRRTASLAALAALLVGVASAAAPPAAAHYSAGSQFQHDRLGQLCGGYRDGAGTWIYVPRACSINFEKSPLLSSYGWATAADAASSRWNGIIDPDTGRADFGYAGYVSGPRQVYMGVRDLGQSSSGITYGTTKSLTNCGDNQQSDACERTGAVIEMSNNSGINWYVNAGSTYTAAGVDWQSVAVHELGHAFGLRHPQQNWDNDHVMGSCLSSHVRRFNGVHDNGGLRYMYGGHRSASWGSPSTAVANCVS